MAMGLIFFLFAGNHLTAQINWEKYEGNPVLSNAAWSDNAVSPVVLFEDGVFKMWFMGDEGLADAIGYAESTDGINWNPNNEPVIPAGEFGKWDRWRMPGSVIRVNDTLKMWYSGSSDNFNYEISIGYAWSINNTDWNVFPDSVLGKGEPGTWEETGVIQPVVYYDGAMYHMWYSGFEGTTWFDPMQEGYATSTNGINWTKHPENPVLTLGPQNSFYDTWVIGSSVIFFGDLFYMWFGGWDGTSTNPFQYWRIGLATSSNGILWTVQNNDQPVVDVGELGTWDDSWAQYCSVIIHDDQLKMWYDGKGNVAMIGYAMGDYVTGIGTKEEHATNPITISPNPFNQAVAINYRLLGKSQITLEIFNHLGRPIKTLVDGDLQQGDQNIIFDGASLAPGIYFCVLKTSTGMQTKKIIKLN